MKYRLRHRNRRRHWQGFLLAGLFLLGGVLVSSAQTVTLFLKNGDRLTGTPVAEDGTHLTLDTSIGRIPVPLAEIEKKETKPPPAAPAAAQPQTPPAPEAPAPAPASPQPTPAAITEALRALSDQYRAGQVPPAEYYRKRGELLQAAAAAEQRQSKAPPPSPPPTKPAAPTPVAGSSSPTGTTKPKTGQQWGGEVRVGTDLGFGTKDRQLVSGALKITQAWQRLRNTADYRVAYGKTDGDVSANRMDGSLKTDWRAFQRFYFYNLGGAGYDEIRRIDLKYETGPGLGLEVLQLKNLGMSVETGLNYYAEEREELERRENFYYRLAQVFTWKLSSRINFDEKFEWFPQAEDTSIYRIRVESNLQYLLGSNMSLVLTVLDLYETETAPDVGNNDLQIRSSLGMKF